MKKVVEFLEQYVEWVVLGLAAVWILWIAWGYVISTPVTVTLSGKPVTAGEVDTIVLEQYAKPLQSAISDPTVPQAPVQNYIQALTQGLQSESRVIERPRLMFAPTLAANTLGPQTQPFVAPAQQKWAGVLAEVPRVEDIKRSTGLSMVIRQQPAAVPGAPLVAVMQPPGAPATAQPEDCDWVWVSGLFSRQAMMAEFGRTKVPAELSGRVVVLRVELQRAETDEKGNIIATKLIDELPMQSSVLGPMPKAFAEQAVYIELADRNKETVMRPGFHSLVKGDPLKHPHDVEPVVPVVGPGAPGTGGAFDPVAAATRLLSLPTGAAKIEYMKQFSAAEQAKIREELAKRRKAEQPAQPPRGKKGDPEFMPPDMMPDGGGRVRYTMRRVPPGWVPPSPDMMNPDMMPPDMMPPDMMPPDMMPGDFGQPQAPLMGAIPAPPTPDKEWVWQYDDTVKPGRTYKYRLRVRTLNPMFNTINAAPPEHQAKANIFALPVEPDKSWSDWSEPVTVPGKTRFFAQFVPPTRSTVAIDVYHWQNGTMNSKRYEVSAGDVIGGTDDNGIDYNTGWTIVDIRPLRSADDWQIVLVREDGVTETRLLNRDRSHPDITKMKEKMGPPMVGAAGGPAIAPPTR